MDSGDGDPQINKTMLEDARRVFANHLERVVPALPKFYIDPKTFAFIGYVHRGLASDLTSPLPDNCVSSPDRSRCPTATAQLLLLLLDAGSDTPSELAQSLSEQGAFTPVASKSPILMPGNIDHIALRLLMTDEEIANHYSTDRSPSQIAAALLEHSLVAPRSADAASATFHNNAQWLQQLFRSSMHNNNNSDASDNSLIVMLGSIMAALAKWHARHVGLLGITRGANHSVRPSTCLMVADCRISHLLWHLCTASQVVSKQWNKSAQSHAYAANLLHYASRLSSQMCDSHTEGDVSLPAKLDDPNSAIVCVQRTSAIKQISELVSNWQQPLAAQIKLSSLNYCETYADDSAKQTHSSACFHLFSWTLLATPEVRSDRFSAHKVFAKIASGISRESGDSSSGELVWSMDDTGSFGRGNHDKPASLELLLFFVIASFWPRLEYNHVSKETIFRYITVVRLISLAIRSLHTNSSRRLYVHDDSRPLSSFVVRFEPNRSLLKEGASSWETLLSVRLSLWGYRLSSLLNRQMVLRRYNTKDYGEYKKRKLRSFTLEEWESEVSNADPYTNHSSTIFELFVRPLVIQASRRDVFLRPAPQGVSFILYGPPGSGKTHAVSEMARVLGWPLLSLGPSDFIKGGADNVEANAQQIFDDLMSLDRCVVFFDECDELFRSRRESSSGARNTLSFATASMLPKLQLLSKKRMVVFVLATNYLSNIDDAVRRDGRFDARLFVDRPHTKERLLYIFRQIDVSFSSLTKYCSAILPGDKDVAFKDLLSSGTAEIKALLSLVALRLTIGFSYTQVNDILKRLLDNIPHCQELLLADGSAEQLLDHLRRCCDHVLSKVPTESANVAGGVPTSLSMTCPIVNEVSIYDQLALLKNGAYAQDAVIALRKRNAFSLFSYHPQTFPSRQTTDYLEWIVSRADAELQAASVEVEKEVFLKDYWVSIPGYHVFLRSWLGRTLRSG